MTRAIFCNFPWRKPLRRSGPLRVFGSIALLLGLSGGISGWELGAIAAEPDLGVGGGVQPTFFPDAEPLDLDLLKPGNAPAAVITSTTISKTGLTNPSFWWARDQYAAGKGYGSQLIENWLAYPVQYQTPGRVDFVVNRQLWNQLNYLQRYSFIHDFGTVARSYGYNLRVFDNQANLLAAYTCNFSTLLTQNGQGDRLPQPASVPPTTSTPLFSTYVPASDTTCYTALDFGGKAGLSGYPSSQTGVGSPRVPGTAGP